MTETTSAQQFWEDFYRERPVWSGRPNSLLVREVEALPPGAAPPPTPPRPGWRWSGRSTT